MTFLYRKHEIDQIKSTALSLSNITSDLLMQRAGQAAFDLSQERFAEAQRITVCVGKGHNAGDGYIFARLAHEAGKAVTVLSLVPLSALSGLVADQLKQVQEAGVTVKVSLLPIAIDADLIVDAMIGTGLSAQLSDEWIAWVNLINDSNADVLALDVPSGIDADTGCMHGAAVEADVTITFIGHKPGLYARKGLVRSGYVTLSTLGIPIEAYHAVSPTVQIPRWSSLKQCLGPRQRDAHKMSFGHVLVIGGDYGMGGAVRMAAEGALRSGAGLVSVATRPEHVTVVNVARPEIMCHEVADAASLGPLLDRATVVVIGPGLGKTQWASDLLTAVLHHHTPKLLDADALNLLSQLEGVHAEDWVLTPHPGEAARLLQQSCQTLQQNRFLAVEQLQAQYGGVVILKGAGTLIKGPGPLTTLCMDGNPGMATAGMGDVLTGIIAALIAQGLSLESAAELGVFVHARAADMAASRQGERGLLATDLFDYLQQCIN